MHFYSFYCLCVHLEPISFIWWFIGSRVWGFFPPLLFNCSKFNCNKYLFATIQGYDFCLRNALNIELTYFYFIISPLKVHSVSYWESWRLLSCHLENNWQATNHFLLWGSWEWKEWMRKQLLWFEMDEREKKNDPTLPTLFSFWRCGIFFFLRPPVSVELIRKGWSIAAESNIVKSVCSVFCPCCFSIVFSIRDSKHFCCCFNVSFMLLLCIICSAGNFSDFSVAFDVKHWSSMQCCGIRM